MKTLRRILVCCAGLIGVFTSFSLRAEDASLRPLPTIKAALTNKSEAATKTLLDELQKLIKSVAHKEYLCTYGLSSSNQSATIDPLTVFRVLFDSVLSELLTRKNEKVAAIMGDLLLSEDLNENDRRTIWSALRQLWKKDFPVILQANNPSQDKNYLLKLTTDSYVEVEVKKGDTLLRLAKKAYPDLSRWSATGIIAFMNDFTDQELIKVGTKLRIYPYQILKDTPASEAPDK